MQKRRFPAVPIVSIALKVIAVLIFIAVLIAVIMQLKEGLPPYMPKPKGFIEWFKTYSSVINNMLLLGLLIPLLTWGIAEMIASLREIEYNTRAKIAAAIESAGPAQGE